MTRGGTLITVRYLFIFIYFSLFQMIFPSPVLGIFIKPAAAADVASNGLSLSNPDDSLVAAPHSGNGRRRLGQGTRAAAAELRPEALPCCRCRPDLLGVFHKNLRWSKPYKNQKVAVHPSCGVWGWWWCGGDLR